MKINKQKVVAIAVLLAAWLFSEGSSAWAFKKTDRLIQGLENPDVIYYSGHGQAGGLAHIRYWTIDLNTLSDREQQKAQRIRANRLHSTLFQPTQVVPGYEVSGILNRNGRKQWITFKLPEGWNGDLVVCGTPGLRNEYANEAIFVPWLLERGYAVISGNKGLDSGWVSMLSGSHPSQHWGRMMHDMARWAKIRLLVTTWRWPHRTYAVGLSNGGYQVRRALEIDAKIPRWHRNFDGGLDWSGTYFPDARVLDADNDGTVAPSEYVAAKTLVGHMDTATLTMGWAYAEDTLTTPAQYAMQPRYKKAHDKMEAVGFNSASNIFWGYYNVNYDTLKDNGFPQWRGVGYANLTSFVFRAELLGHGMSQSAAYSCFYDPANPDEPPPIYAWLENTDNGGWSSESIQWALRNANTAEFKAPMITLVGSADGLLALNAHSVAYKKAVQKYGKKKYYRQYLIENGPHVDAHADGLVDFNFDRTPGNEWAGDELTPLQAYAQRAFTYLTDWVEMGTRPPRSQTVQTDPMNDVTDPELLSW